MEDFTAVQIVIEDVRQRMSLAILDDGHYKLFQVERVSFSHSPAKGTVWTIESEPVDGKPWVIKAPPKTKFIRLIRGHRQLDGIVASL